ncbi:MAG: hypoxanthine phosphoribosyltransferase [Clostridiales bacterium]|jgi:hypoxanthine phosphoribosyltransferase|nr:hypoxanthine phosphoribosyltransferase [Clostridiales bacterium]
MKETVKPLIEAGVIQNRLNELAEKITKDYAGGKLTLVCVLKGAVIFMVDLARKIGGEVEVEFDFMDISSYGSSMESGGVVRIDKDLDVSLEGKNVLLVEDIIDSGRTLSRLREHLNLKKPKSLRICTLLDKPDARVINDVSPEYVGFKIPDEFVVGYGLDYAERYRNLSYIGTLSIENDEEDMN